MKELKAEVLKMSLHSDSVWNPVKELKENVVMSCKFEAHICGIR
mgnify:CR=1 FL=1